MGESSELCKGVGQLGRAEAVPGGRGLWRGRATMPGVRNWRRIGAPGAVAENRTTVAEVEGGT